MRTEASVYRKNDVDALKWVLFMGWTAPYFGGSYCSIYVEARGRLQGDLLLLFPWKVFLNSPSFLGISICFSPKGTKEAWLGGVKTVIVRTSLGTSTFLRSFIWSYWLSLIYFCVRGFISSNVLVVDKTVRKALPWISLTLFLSLNTMFYLQVEGEGSINDIPMHPYIKLTMTLLTSHLPWDHYCYLNLSWCSTSNRN